MLERRPSIAEAARRFAPSRRYWAIVGNGPNRIAAEEVRIKLSELCYKSIACDVTEDKKHIDLSSEPLILVCAAGLVGSTADDVAKEVAIYRAHKAAPIVIATEGEERFGAALRGASSVPAVDPALAFVLSAMVGHLFGYEAALAIDALARPAARGRERDRGGGVRRCAAATWCSTGCATTLGPGRRTGFPTGCAAGAYDGHLEASTAVRLTSLLRYATGPLPLDVVPARVRQGRHARGARRRPHRRAHAGHRGAHPSRRRHQAPGQDGHRRHLPLRRGRCWRRRSCARCSTAGAGRDRLSYRTLRTLAGSAPAVEEVVGFTRYRIEGDPEAATPRSRSSTAAASARDLPSRIDAQPPAAGHQAPGGARARGARWPGVAATAARVVLVPEMKGGQSTGITLLHVRFPSACRRPRPRACSRATAVATTPSPTPSPRPSPRSATTCSATVDAVDLLTEPIPDLADRWRA